MLLLPFYPFWLLPQTRERRKRIQMKEHQKKKGGQKRRRRKNEEKKHDQQQTYTRENRMLQSFRITQLICGEFMKGTRIKFLLTVPLHSIVYQAFLQCNL